MVVDSLVTVPPGDRFLSPAPTGEEVMREARLLAGTYYSSSVLSVCIPRHNSVPGNVTMFLPEQWYVTLHYALWGLEFY